MRYFSTEQLLDKLQMSGDQLGEFEQKGIVTGTVKAERVFYTSRDMYRLRGILVFLSRGLALEEAVRRVDQPPTKEASRRIGGHSGKCCCAIRAKQRTSRDHYVLKAVQDKAIWKTGCQNHYYISSHIHHVCSWQTFLLVLRLDS